MEVYVFNNIVFLAAQPSNGGAGVMSNLVIFALIILIFYFMIIRPQQRRAKERQMMLSNLKRGDRVITSGGIYGTIVGLEENTVTLQIADNVKIKVERGAIASVLSETEGKTF